ncbi:MAG: hypothetical protein IKL82_00515 [Clostridia bacterium]|nr:hypothetical protein [Clostridia bacterium]
MKKKKYVKDLKTTAQYKHFRENWVPYFFKLPKKHNITDVQALLISIISEYSKLENGCYNGTVQTLRVICNCSASTVMRSLDALVARKLIKKTEKTQDKLPEYRLNIKLKNEPYIRYYVKDAVKYNLKTTEAIIFSAVVHYSNKPSGVGSISCEALKMMVNGSRSTVKRAISRLVEEEHVHRITRNWQQSVGYTLEPGEVQQYKRNLWTNPSRLHI